MNWYPEPIDITAETRETIETCNAENCESCPIARECNAYFVGIDRVVEVA
jgi:hypothetical protein